ncbi:hypothetical protein [Streptomyces sp. SPB4]|uniref:hypothetical protein n=1 Tax=Streptomyces sp. SPB4 TaxID=2940553 RepID=UPI0024758656|nr:hypothetical protein [Streptomyces sp. SPB4]MDH6540020.1 hypothetical protein [Streptomyces sp. SPB4]
MNHGEGEDALVLAAQEMLAAGRSEEEVFAELAARTGEWSVCVLAVCSALGVPRTDAEARLREVEPFFAEFAAGEEADLALLLTFGHVFVVDRVLDEHEEHIRDLLGTAAGARGGFPGSLLGWFRTGELTKIFLYFAKTRFRDGRGSPPDFWAAMTAAGELLASQGGADHAEVTAGLDLCRTQAAAIGSKVGGSQKLQL